MRCKCGERLTPYDMAVKKKVQLESGKIIEIHEDLCSKCRKSWDSLLDDEESDNMEEMEE